LTVFGPTSRYHDVEIATHVVSGPDGTSREVRFVRRRFIPDLRSAPTLVEHRVAQGDRIDNLAARYVGDPTQFWRVCDANIVLHPDELTDRLGRPIRIAAPEL
jgi:hypothetical protein